MFREVEAGLVVVALVVAFLASNLDLRAVLLPIHQQLQPGAVGNQFRTGIALLRQEFTRVTDAIHEDQK